MAILEPIFNDTVWTPLWLADAAGSDTEVMDSADTQGTQQGTIETPALRPPENPFKTLMKKIDTLMGSDNIHDIRNALYMVHGALDDKQYSCDQEHKILSDRWLELHEKLRPEDPEFTAQPTQKIGMAA